jgi:CRP-like cAMP-binding protein
MEYTATGNELLDLVARSDKEGASFIVNDARLVTFEGGLKLQSAGAPVDSCYFPKDGVLALVHVVDDGHGVETLGVGFDGAVHAGFGMHLDRASHRVVSRLPGQSWTIGAARWQAFLDGNSTVRKVVAGFIDTQICRMHQALACQMHHDLESRFCRCLLELHRWQRGRPLAITHKGLSQYLGVRRATVTLLAQSLQEAGIICYGRGAIEVTDTYALRQASCSCCETRRAWEDPDDGDRAVEGAVGS